MRKHLFSILVLLVMPFFGITLKAQPGASCATPHVIPSLPFMATGLNTSAGANVFDTTMACQSQFMGGNEYIFVISPTTDKIINIALSGTGQNVGLFVINGCASDPTSYCISSVESLMGNPTLSNIQLHADSVYHIVISTRVLSFPPLPPIGQTTAFGITVTEVNPNDMQMMSILTPISSCNLTASEAVTIKIKNNGMVAATGVQVAYKLNNLATVVEPIPGTITIGDSVTYTFTVNADLTAPMTHQLKAWTILTNDGNNNNDTLVNSINSIPLISTFPYLQDFEANDGGWYKSPTTGSWAWGIPAADTIATAASGTKAWVTNLAGNTNLGEISYLNSPCIDLSTVSLPIVKVKVNRKMTTGQNTALQYSIDGGQTWMIAGSQNANWYNNANGWTGSSFGAWETKHVKIPAIGNQSDVRLRFAYSGGFQTTEGIGIDDIEIYNSPANDIGVVEIMTPVSSCGMGNEVISVKIANFGSAAQTNFPVGYSINGAPFVYENVALSIAVGDTIEYNFAAVDLSAIDTYEIEVKTNLTGDADNTNDMASKTVVNTIAVASFPYFENFENGNGSWSAGGTSPSWELATPAGTAIIGAASGTHAWVTGADTVHNANENSWVMSPCFDMTSLTIPVIELKLNYNTTANIPLPIGGANVLVEYSLDNGGTWLTLGVNGDPTNWYNAAGGWSGTSSGWTMAKRQSPELAGESSVRLRVRLNATTALLGASEGVAFDDIKIYEMPQKDISIVSIEAPVGNCNMGNEFISVKITNLGAQAQSNFPVHYSINGGTVVNGNVANTLAFGDTIFYTFQTPANFTAIQSYDLVVFSALVGDEDTSNDTISMFIVNSPVLSTFPYAEDFEDANHNWVAGGINSSWEVGIPSNQTITPQAAGNNSFITNASGNFNENENSFVVSPCFDFTSLSNPYIKMNIFYDLPADNMMSPVAVLLESSIDGGFTWTTVGQTGTGTNWYNGSALIPGFGSAGWQGSSAQWLDAAHLLNGTGNQSAVKLRVSLGTGQSMFPIPIPGGSTTAGFAFDDVEIKQCVGPNLSFYTSINNRTVTFNNTSTNASNYAWDFGDGNVSNTTSPTHTYANNGVYVVKLVASSECMRDSITQQVQVGSVGIQTNQGNANIVCLPNPNDGSFDVVIENVNETAKVSLINALGQIVKSEVVNVNGRLVYHINEPSLEKGIYFVQIQTAQFTTTKKVVVR
jgi:plastocyanin